MPCRICRAAVRPFRSCLVPVMRSRGPPRLAGSVLSLSRLPHHLYGTTSEHHPRSAVGGQTIMANRGFGLRKWAW